MVIYQENINSILKKISRKDNFFKKVLKIKDMLDVSNPVSIRKFFEDLTEDQLIKNNKKIKGFQTLSLEIKKTY